MSEEPGAEATYCTMPEHQTLRAEIDALRVDRTDYHYHVSRLAAERDRYREALVRLVEVMTDYEDEMSEYACGHLAVARASLDQENET